MVSKYLRRMSNILAACALLACLAPGPSVQAKAITLSDAQVDNLVRRSYQYVAMYNVNNKFALKQGGWNTVNADTKLKDHAMREIARPNNDTLYITCMLDLRKDPVILEMPAFDSKYVSLMITAYDHYVNIPMSTRLGDFRKPEKMLIYSARTEGYKGEAIKGVDRRFEATGDFVSAVLRIMPHANEPERFKRIVKQMQSVKLVTLSEYRGGKVRPIDDIQFPPVGKTDADVFGNNLLQVMQFVFNHTTFDPKNELDKAVLAVYEPLGVVPGRASDPARVAKIDGARFPKAAERIAAAELAKTNNPAFRSQMGALFQPKGRMTLELLLSQSVIGPIGMPASEAVYPPIVTTDGKPMNAKNDYVIRMSKKDLPPAKAFWSVTLYDVKNGFFIPNDRKKYSVGENAGMKLDDKGGVAIYIAAQKPKGVPEENWLPINRRDEDIGAIMRIYVPDLEKMKTWEAPKAAMIKPTPEKKTLKTSDKVNILKSWQGDYPVAQLNLLPEGQCEQPVGFINDATTFEGLWKAFEPGKAVPEIDFKVNLVLFARNTQFHNRIRIGKVNVINGVAEVLAMETMSAMPIEEKVGISLVVVAKQDISGIQAGDKVITIKDNR